MVLISVMFAVVLVATVAVLTGLSRQLHQPLPAVETSHNSDEQPITNYEPMLRLLSAKDLEFLRRQPGYSRRMEAKFRAERSRMFRVYLRSLRGDFRSTCASLKQVMLHSEVDRADLASLLLRSQWNFAYGFTLAQVNVVFFRWGIATPDCAALLEPFRGVRAALEMLTPIAEPAGA